MPTLHWNTRDADIHAAERAPYHAISAVPELAHGQPDSNNLLIQGDNLLALKALVPHYAAAVKCVYIDPPFNTGTAFEDYDDNLEHTQWLGMMYPRFALLHELLAKDGSIWISIDGREAAYMKIILDEIFGRENVISIITNTTAAASGLRVAAPRIFGTANYIYAYAKNAKFFKLHKQHIERGHDKGYSKFLENPDAHYSEWRWTNLTDKVAANLGCSSVREAKQKVSPEAFEDEIARFAIANAERVFGTAAFTGGGANNLRAETIMQSAEEREKVFVHPDDKLNYYILNGRQMIFYDKILIEVDERRVPGQVLTDVWTDITWMGIADEGGVKLKNGKKPERLVERVLKLATDPGDLVLDSFLGSGTTVAVAHKMGRRWVGIEIGEQAETHCAKRLRDVVDGKDASGITVSAKWQGGGGFRFSRLGPPIFTEDGDVHPEIKFPELATHIWFSETRTPLSPRRSPGPYLGAHKGVGYALLYNGILKDKRANGGNILIRSTLSACRSAATADGLDSGGNLIIYGNGNRLSAATLKQAGVEFRQVPYEVKKR